VQVLDTLQKHRLLVNLEKREFALQLLVFLGQVIREAELKIDLAKMEAIVKWPYPINVTRVGNFMGET
jgi:hypothetical protein